MTVLFQPISRTFGSRDGCLTPNNHSEDRHSKSVDTDKSDFAASEGHKILSPPLSPYQRESFPPSATEETGPNYLASENPYKVENFRSYSLTVNPWNNLNGNYKQRHLKFLSQYAFDAAREASSSHYMRLAERRAERKRKQAVQTTSSDSDSDSFERVRTRRVAKENHAPLSEIESSSSKPSSPAPKKRKVRKETYVGSPLAAQQAALIDESIPDYSPDPYTTLPKGNNRALKIEWKGQAMDLRSDPNLDALHPAEVLLASTLRLPCNVYLDSKRRLFHEKVNRLKNNMPFRRTDAQKACRIDVNKASRLFAAFEKVGWLHDKHFTKFV